MISDLPVHHTLGATHLLCVCLHMWYRIEYVDMSEEKLKVLNCVLRVKLNKYANIWSEMGIHFEIA